jgi:hypothetical protein
MCVRYLHVLGSEADSKVQHKNSFKDIPHDTRYLVAKARKARLGEHRSGRIFHRPSIKDFPKEWLPDKEEPLNVPDLNGTERADVTQ